MAKLTNKRLVLPDAGRHLCTLASVQEVENKFYTPGKDSDDKKLRLEWTFVYDDKPEMQITEFTATAFVNSGARLSRRESRVPKPLAREDRALR